MLEMTVQDLHLSRSTGLQETEHSGVAWICVDWAKKFGRA